MQKTAKPERRPPTTVPAERRAHDTELVDEMDDFLNEVDALLEDQEWLLRYRQKGGQ
jgi:hypothetical protein